MPNTNERDALIAALKFHPSASHVSPDFRDLFNKTLDQHAVALAATAPNAGAPLADSQIVMQILNGGGWELYRAEPWEALTDEANAEKAWFVKRTRAPFCDQQSMRQWAGPTALSAFATAFSALGLVMPAAAPAQQAGAPLPLAPSEAARSFRLLLTAEIGASIDVSGDIARQEAQIDMADHLLVKFNELFPEAS
ncbi:hypothetical protein [Variovorax sp. UMC13]|uniref:hypothetical protein n=1 Tax=Variovorax sp. UMC13 TaxID=1862326 RepID=UPI0016040F1E|nr:hypothetical protein [Variovorax sp. UMC13]MBB1599525.1 hypothetical protein [Variovorax sp. UMC13]